MANKKPKIKGFGKPREHQPGWRRSLSRRFVKYPAITAVALVVTLALARSSLPATSAPVTPSATSKLTVYQGVVVVAPGGVGDDVLELGNAGRDIASTGAIYLRPNSTGGSSYFSGSGNTQNLYLSGNLGVGVAGSSYPFVVGRDVDGQVYGARFQNMSTGAAAYLRPLSFLRRNAANTTTMEWYWELPVGDTPELQLWRANRPDGQPVGWSNPVSFKYDGTTYFNGGNVGIGNITPAGKFVVNNNLAGNGSSGDAIAAYANTTGSALYAQQNNASGWAGYFSGRVNVTSSITLGGRAKSTWRIEVCQVGSDTCLGQYTISKENGAGLTDDQYCYFRASDDTIQCVNIYNLIDHYCSGTNTPVERATSGISYFEVGSCTGEEYTLATPWGDGIVGGSYPDAGTWVCITSALSSVAWASTGGPAPTSCTINNSGSGSRKAVTGNAAPNFTPVYELR